MDKRLEEYIYKEVIPKYSLFDEAHQEDHASAVIRQSFQLLDGKEEWLSKQDNPDPLWMKDVDRNMLLTAAACHDLGLEYGRENHHMDSGRMIRTDNRLKEWFDENQIETIAQAAEDHRASGTHAPRSIYGMLVAEADRLIDKETIIRRTIQYGMKHYPELDKEMHIARAVGHLKEKYGRNGYLKLWIPWSENASNLSALQDMIANEEAITTEVACIYEELDNQA